MAITRVSGLHAIKPYSATVKPEFHGDRYTLQRLDNGNLVAVAASLGPNTVETHQLTVLNAAGTANSALATLVTEDAQHSLLSLDVSPTAGGGFFVDWGSDTESAPTPFSADSFGRFYTQAGVAAGPAFSLSNKPGGGEFRVSAVHLGNGNTLAVWNDTQDTGFLNVKTNTLGRIYNAAGMAVGDEFLLGSGSGIQLGTGALAFGDGRTLVSWANGTLSGDQLHSTDLSGRFLDANGAPVGPVLKFDTIASGKVYDDQDAVALGNGGFVVAWHEEASDGKFDEVHFQRFNAAGVKAGGEVIVVATDGLSPHIEHMNMFELANGGFGIEWRLSDGGVTSGHVRQFAMDGVEIGAETVLQPVAKPGGASGLTYVMDMELTANGHVMAFGLDTSTPAFSLGTQEFDFGDERMLGTSGNDRLFGRQGVNDVILGMAGNDTIDGLSGNDSLTGGAGSDTFVFNSAPSATNRDTITDYSTAADTIWLDNAIYTGLGTMTGVLKATLYYEGTAAHLSTDRIVYDPATGTLNFDKDGRGAAAAVLIATLNDTPGHHPTALAMSSAEFLVI